MKTAITDGLVVETVLVGYNQAALIVPKGNPKKITPDPANLANEQYAVVIANPKSGSIDRQPKKILEKRGVWKAASDNVIYLTTDSKDITKAIKSGEADLAINWYATAFWPENRDYIQAIPLDPAPAAYHRHDRPCHVRRPGKISERGNGRLLEQTGPTR